MDTGLEVFGLQKDGEEFPADQDQRRYVGHIQCDSQHLMHLINGLLDLSKIKAGAFQLRWETFDAAGASKEVIDSEQPSARKSRLGLKLASRNPRRYQQTTFVSNK